jgi:hypothetical protein
LGAIAGFAAFAAPATGADAFGACASAEGGTRPAAIIEVASK